MKGNTRINKKVNHPPSFLLGFVIICWYFTTKKCFVKFYLHSSISTNPQEHTIVFSTVWSLNPPRNSKMCTAYSKSIKLQNTQSSTTQCLSRIGSIAAGRASSSKTMEMMEAEVMATQMSCIISVNASFFISLTHFKLNFLVLVHPGCPG